MSRPDDPNNPSSIQWRNHKQLEKVATIDELISLTDHKNGVVRCYAFEALTNKQKEKTFPILLNHLYETDSVNVTIGCATIKHKIRNYFLHIQYYAYKLTSSQQEIVDGILNK